jgi:hypothetical protein
MSIFFAAPIDQHPDYAKVTTVPTATNADPNFPIANILTFDPTQVFAATTTSTVITWNFGASVTFDMVSLVYTNLTDAATLLIEGSTNGTAWATLYNSTALAHVVAGQTTQNKINMLRHNSSLLNLATPVSYQYLRLTVNSQVAGLFPSIGRLFVGTKFVPSTGWQYGSQFTFADNSVRQRTDRGTLIVDPQPPIVAANVKLDFLNKNEMYDYVYDFNYWRGAAREFFACLDVEDTKRLQKNILYCTISDGRLISFDSYNTHSVAWMLESIGIG